MKTFDALDSSQDLVEGHAQRSAIILQSMAVIDSQVFKTFHNQGSIKMLGEIMEHAIKAGFDLDIRNCHHQIMPVIFITSSSMAQCGASFSNRMRKTYMKVSEVFNI